jgi:RNA polymerase sigma factor for flagellar operon FliA
MSTQSMKAAPAAGPAHDERQRMIEEHLGLVHFVAKRMFSSGTDADLDELISAGTMGLMAAVDHFDTSRGLAFSTYAAPRIRGAILDELRRQDHVPRSVRRRSRDLARAHAELGQALGRDPSQREVADHLGLDADTLFRWESDVDRIHEVSIFDPGPDGDNRRTTLADSLPSEAEESVEDRINGAEEAEILRRAIAGLVEQDRIVLTLYYFEELKLHEIATILGLTESRVSQIRSRALKVLRGTMAPLRDVHLAEKTSRPARKK